MRNLSHKLRESANTLGRQQTHEIPVMVGFCSRLRDELREAADEIDKLRAALTESNALLGCIIAAWPSKEMLPKVEKQYDENLVILR